MSARHFLYRGRGRAVAPTIHDGGHTATMVGATALPRPLAPLPTQESLAGATTRFPLVSANRQCGRSCLTKSKELFDHTIALRKQSRCAAPLLVPSLLLPR